VLGERLSKFLFDLALNRRIFSILKKMFKANVGLENNIASDTCISSKIWYAIYYSRS